MHDTLINLVDSLSRKTVKTGSEWAAYQQGIQYAEKLFKLNKIILDKQLNELEEQNGDQNGDQEYTDTPQSL